MRAANFAKKGSAPLSILAPFPLSTSTSALSRTRHFQPTLRISSVTLAACQKSRRLHTIPNQTTHPSKPQPYVPTTSLYPAARRSLPTPLSDLKVQVLLTSKPPALTASLPSTLPSALWLSARPSSTARRGSSNLIDRLRNMPLDKRLVDTSLHYITDPSSSPCRTPSLHERTRAANRL